MAPRRASAWLLWLTFLELRRETLSRLIWNKVCAHSAYLRVLCALIVVNKFLVLKSVLIFRTWTLTDLLGPSLCQKRCFLLSDWHFNWSFILTRPLKIDSLRNCIYILVRTLFIVYLFQNQNTLIFDWSPRWWLIGFILLGWAFFCKLTLFINLRFSFFARI